MKIMDTRESWAVIVKRDKMIRSSNVKKVKPATNKKANDEISQTSTNLRLICLLYVFSSFLLLFPPLPLSLTHSPHPYVIIIIFYLGRGGKGSERNKERYVLLISLLLIYQSNRATNNIMGGEYRMIIFYVCKSNRLLLFLCFTNMLPLSLQFIHTDHNTCNSIVCACY